MDFETNQAFRNHPFIQSIANIPKWTISDDKKMPLDMQKLITEDKIQGANFYNEQSLATLDEVDNFFTQLNQIPKNHTFYLNTVTDEFMILDIEPECPEEIRQKLLNTPFLYGEVSLSGKGIHLVFGQPACFLDYPNAYKKPALKEEHKYYEILLNHFCTFTGKMIPHPKHPTADFNEIYKSLATQARQIEKQKEAQIQSLTDKPNTEQADTILRLLDYAGKHYSKKPSDFVKDKIKCQPDMSRYEWSFIAYLNWKLQSILEVSAIKKEPHTYTDEEKAYFLYEIATRYLKHRPKHDTYRTTGDNVRLPWLGYLVKDVIEKTTKEDEK